MSLIQGGTIATPLYIASDVTYIDNPPTTTGTVVSPDLIEEPTPASPGIPDSQLDWLPANCIRYSGGIGTLIDGRIYHRMETAGLSLSAGQVIVPIWMCDDDGNYRNGGVNYSMDALITNSNGLSSEAMTLQGMLVGQTKRRFFAPSLACTTDDFIFTGVPPDFGSDFDVWNLTISREVSDGQILNQRFLGVWSGHTVGKGLITIEIDDNNVSMYDVAFPSGRDRGVMQSATINGKNIQDAAPQSVDLPQILEMRDSGWWEFNNHGWEHLNWRTIPYNDLYNEIVTNHNWMVDNGLMRSYPGRAMGAAGPQGEGDNASRDLLLELGYSLCRLSDAPISPGNHRGTFIGLGRILNPMNLKSISLDAISGGNAIADAASAIALIDTAIAKGEWIHFRVHQIVETPTLIRQFATADYNAILDHIVTRRSEGVLEDVTYGQMAVRAGLAQTHGLDRYDPGLPPTDETLIGSSAPSEGNTAKVW